MGNRRSRRARPGDEETSRRGTACGRLAGRSRGAKAVRHIGLMTGSLTCVLLLALLAAPAPVVLRPAQVDAAVTGSTTVSDSATPARDPEAVAAWLRVERPLPMFDLASAELEGLERRYDAARHPAGGGRDDVLVFGRFAGDAAHLRVSAYRTGSEAPPAGTFFVDLVRRAGESGLAVARSAVAGPVTTKFGAMEMADARIGGEGVERACLAFRLVLTQPGLRLSGWFCGNAQRPADRTALVCVIDRLDLVAAADDRELAQWFAQAEKRRVRTCSTPHLYASGRKSTWLDPRQGAPLRVAMAK